MQTPGAYLLSTTPCPDYLRLTNAALLGGCQNCEGKIQIVKVAVASYVGSLEASKIARKLPVIQASLANICVAFPMEFVSLGGSIYAL